jgi:hypothetical protein
MDNPGVDFRIGFGTWGIGYNRAGSQGCCPLRWQISENFFDSLRPAGNLPKDGSQDAVEFIGRRAEWERLIGTSISSATRWRKAIGPPPDFAPEMDSTLDNPPMQDDHRVSSTFSIIDMTQPIIQIRKWNERMTHPIGNDKWEVARRDF